jgi:hypothetical protein
MIKQCSVKMWYLHYSTALLGLHYSIITYGNVRVFIFNFFIIDVFFLIITKLFFSIIDVSFFIIDVLYRV